MNAGIHPLFNQTTLVFAVFTSSLASLLGQDNISHSQLKFFEEKIRPALVKYCYECHSREENTSRGGLLLDTRSDILSGGDNGPSVVPGDVEGSLFWEAITWMYDDLEMPPDEKMPAHVINDFKEWIEMGAPDPRKIEKAEFHTNITEADIREGQKHWSFQGPRAHPEATIDRIVDKKLAAKGVEPAPSADVFTLLRRMYFDTIGLPPTIAEIKSFYSEWKQDKDQAIKTKVEELLLRPQYGERWGRHWLDVARYAESSGSRNASFPNAWRYRDYVIDSFNKDKPYDRFIKEQIAGDLLPVKTDEQWQENLIATGFLAIGLKHLDQKNPRQFMSDMVDEQIDTMTQSMLGLTVACARCHDHKSDPIPTHDYYAMAGMFYSTSTYYGTQRVAQLHRPSDLIILPISDRVSLDKSKHSYEQVAANVKRIKAQLATMKPGRSADGSKDYKHTLNVLRRAEGELATMNPDGTKKTYGMGVQERKQMVNATILLGGEIERPAQEVPRGFLQVLGNLNFEVETGKSGRRQLAESMSSSKNPLTARVMVNRIWKHLLGKPLVETPNNFGISGVKPTNQELLDYLAVRLMKQGWSVRRMIHEIMLSDTYQRSSQYIAKNYEIDPDNQLLWRANPRHLDAESMRDGMLSLAGRLDLKRPLGSPVAAGGEGRPGSANLDYNARYRSVYLPVIRDMPAEALNLFGFPDANITSGARAESIVPTQALYMMNGDFVHTQASAMAAHLSKQFSSTGDRVRNAFLQIYGRPATDGEMQASVQFFRDFDPGDAPPKSTASNSSSSSYGKGKSKRGKSRKGKSKGSKGRRSAEDDLDIVSTDETLTVFCQTLMSSARFRILN